ncbi:hypothetical protein HK103_007655 [Boothiomyces macroporosus]|uniref:CBM21 domain-containing protein n=1 Tax=Boothiomyces macroporosus TaxID=261099 RepID=A0AAD5UBS3_9FUNG|nr:hypothetical protein HK103_007655 [Boothiomyces macroporosus]
MSITSTITYSKISLKATDLSHNDRPVVVRSVSLVDTQRKIKKSLKFSTHIEEICHFNAIDPPKMLVKDITYVQDDEDVVAGSVSKWMRNFWSLLAPRPMPLSINRSNIVLGQMQIVNMQLKGTIWVANLAMEKHVNIHATFDDWQTIRRFSCHFDPHTVNAQNLDAFQFHIDLKEFKQSSEVNFKFAINYRCNGNEFWDNNNSANYHVIIKKKVKRRMNTPKQLKQINLIKPTVASNCLLKSVDPIYPSICMI